MSEEAAFHAAMAADPNDRTNKLVYADWLEEHGHAQQAQRLRWWARLQAHYESPSGAKRASARGDLPEWVQRLQLVHRIRRGLADHSDPTNPHYAVTQQALASAEREALGLETPERKAPVVRAVAGHRRDGGRALWEQANYDNNIPARLFMAAQHTLGGAIPLDSHHPQPNLQSARGWLTTGIAPPVEPETRRFAAKDKVPLSRPTRLAAIAPPTDTNGVLVRVPQAPAAPAPAKVAPQRAPQRPGRTGPAFILPQ